MKGSPVLETVDTSSLQSNSSGTAAAARGTAAASAAVTGAKEPSQQKEQQQPLPTTTMNGGGGYLGDDDDDDLTEDDPINSSHSGVHVCDDNNFLAALAASSSEEDDDFAEASNSLLQQQQQPKQSPVHMNHKRTISWGIEKQPTAAAARRNNRLSVAASRFASVKQINPLEQEAETHIITALEDMEAKNEARGTKEPPILEFVPRGSENIFLDSNTSGNTQQQHQQHQHHHHARNPSRDDSKATNTSSNGGQRSVGTAAKGVRQRRAADHRAAHHRRVHTTVEEDMFNLTHALNALHDAGDRFLPREESSSSDATMRKSAKKKQAQHGRGSAEHMAVHGTMLFRRRRSVVVDGDGNKVSAASAAETGREKQGNDARTSLSNSGEQVTAGGNAKDKWKKLRLAVNVTQAARTKKDTGADNDGPSASATLYPHDENDIEGGTTPATTGDSGDPENGGDHSDGDHEDSSTHSKTTSHLQPSKLPMLHFLRGKAVVVNDFVKENRQTINTFISWLTIYLIIPLLAVAFILFYPAGNPPTGIIAKSVNGTLFNREGNVVDPNRASHSWWVLFAVRQLVTFGLASASEVVVIDILCMRLRLLNVFKSPMLTLLVIQSRGWPFLAVAWPLYDKALLLGDEVFVRHWMYYQDFLDIFNESNPSGHFTSNPQYRQVLVVSLSIGLIVSVKRVVVGFVQGKSLFARYGEQVTAVMRKVLLISQVGLLAREMEEEALSNNGRSRLESRSVKDSLWAKVEQFVEPDEDEESESDPPRRSSAKSSFVLDPDARDEFTGSISQSQRMKITELLGQWEPPEKETSEIDSNISVRSILQFRETLEVQNVESMFGYFFGPTDTREQCIESSQEVFTRLNYQSNNEAALSFHVLALLALNSDGSLKHEKIEDLIRVFRPERDGTLSVLDFVKSVDTVYKEGRLLRASIQKTQRLDHAVERIFNVGFYTVLGAVTLAMLGIDPMALFLSLSSIILAFAFMIGSASAKYFEGLLFILVRKPYNIGDRVFFNEPNDKCNSEGSPSWFVRDVSLYHTTFVFGLTNECCTVSNGSLANLRCINMARSPKGILKVYLKFGTEVPWSKIQVFEKSLRAFVKSRPREWLGVNGFRTTRVESDLGFQEVVVILQHRDSWQNTGALLRSKAEVAAFCHELQKKMDMRYKSPPLPVDLTVNQPRDPFTIKNDKDVGQAVVTKFEGLSAGPTSDGTCASVDLEWAAQLFGKKDD